MYTSSCLSSVFTFVYLYSCRCILYVCLCECVRLTQGMIRWRFWHWKINDFTLHRVTIPIQSAAKSFKRMSNSMRNLASTASTSCLYRHQRCVLKGQTQKTIVQHITIVSLFRTSGPAQSPSSGSRRFFFLFFCKAFLTEISIDFISRTYATMSMRIMHDIVRSWGVAFDII